MPTPQSVGALRSVPFAFDLRKDSLVYTDPSTGKPAAIRLATLRKLGWRIDELDAFRLPRVST